jgi:predicted nucleotide-binding protein
MINRFRGARGHKRLIDALLEQTIVCHEKPVAEALAGVGDLLQIEPNTARSDFILENGDDDDLYLILAGDVSVRIKGREIATRSAGTHVGDMALIEPKAPRSACVSVKNKTVLLRVSEQSFSNLAEKHPVMWRRLAVELAERLRQRSKLIREQNPRPVVFIGSSSENMRVALTLKRALGGPSIQVNVWKDSGVFLPSQTTIEGLTQAAIDSDFSVLVLGAEDIVTSRNSKGMAPRDNVIFELGLFMGAIGRNRTCALKPQGLNLKIPSDLLGLTLLSYDATRSRLRAALRDACNEILNTIHRLGVK